MAAGLSWWSAKSFWVTPRIARLNEDGPFGWVSTTAGMDLVMSVAATAPSELRSAPVTADSEMPMSCEFCSRFCAVTTISSSVPEDAVVCAWAE